MDFIEFFIVKCSYKHISIRVTKFHIKYKCTACPGIALPSYIVRVKVKIKVKVNSPYYGPRMPIGVQI